VKEFPDYLPFNPYKLKKADLQMFLTGRCRHRHTYLSHPNCFVTEYLLENKKFTRGFLDIEASSLVADFGIILSYVIKVEGKKKYYSSTITKSDLENGNLDKGIVTQLVKDLQNFDEVITYYGTQFDLKFIRSRYLYWAKRDKKFAKKVKFPWYGYIKHKDVYYMAKNRLRLHRTRLDDVTRFLNIKGKTHIEPEYWIKALTGNKKSLSYILDHNKKDVDILEKVYKDLEPYVRKTNRSI